MAEESIFAKIISGDIPSDQVFSDEQCIAFRDIQPQAPVHILIIPKKEIKTINDISSSDAIVLGKLFLIAKKIAKKMSIDKDGYRLVMNCNEYGGQSVYHIHLHLMGGRKLSWPPG